MWKITGRVQRIKWGRGTLIASEKKLSSWKNRTLNTKVTGRTLLLTSRKHSVLADAASPLADGYTWCSVQSIIRPPEGPGESHTERSPRSNWYTRPAYCIFHQWWSPCITSLASTNWDSLTVTNLFSIVSRAKRPNKKKINHWSYQGKGEKGENIITTNSN